MTSGSGSDLSTEPGGSINNVPNVRIDVDPPIRTGVPPSHYQAYLNSPGWRTRRNRALREARFQCSRCPSRRDLEVHHLSYERLGLERDSDLEVLCVTCHRGEHLEDPDQTSLGLYLRLASAAIDVDPFASIADLSDAIKTACVKLKIPQKTERINAALAVVCGNRLRAPRPNKKPVENNVGKISAAPVTKAEARELLCRLNLAGVVKQIPSAKASRIDIYAPVQEPDWGDHDLY